MQIDPEDRLTDQEPSQSSSSKTMLIGVAVIIAIAAVVYFYLDQPEEVTQAPPPAPPPIVTPAPAPEQPPALDIPEPMPAIQVEPNEPEPEPEPTLTLETSDEELRLDLGDAGESDLLDSVLKNNDLVQRSASMIDGMSRGILLGKVLPVAPPKGKFSTVTEQGNEYMDPAGYERYDSYAQSIEALDTDTLASTFHRFRPLLEEAYGTLGYPKEDFDNALIRALDRVLLTPEITEPIELTRKEAIYQYADPELEELTDLQKQLLRMGPDNINKIKRQAAALRAALLDPAR
ncbi:MAG: DUF3014 domain-containing protein [Halioglobus sp.]